MSEMTSELFLQLWQMAKSQQNHADPELQRMQKFMVMHEDMHPYFEQLEQDPSMSLEVDGENLMLHILMDSATEKSLELDEPMGIRSVMEVLLSSKVDPGVAFHVISQAMTHSFLIAADEGREMDMFEFMSRAQQYSAQLRLDGLAGGN